MLEVIFLHHLELLPYFAWKAPPSAATVVKQALKKQSRIFAMRPQIVNPVYDAGISPRGRHGPDLGGQRGEPFERPLMQRSVLKEYLTHCMPASSRVGC